MVVSFDPLMLLVWIFLTCFIPGAILSFSLFRDSKYLWFEKLLIGFGLGLIILPMIPFLLYFIAGVKFSFAIALLSAALFYVIAIALFVRSKAHLGLKMPQFALDKNLAIALIIGLIILVSFWIRILPYSPIFFELDPYYYTDVAQQILTMGANPANDMTAWYPDVTVSHRTVPVLGYLEALWYTFYNGGTAYDNMLLATIASLYPPIAAVLALFFLYLFVSNSYPREWGVLAAGIASFVPIFLLKTTAGEMEVQPFAFFALAIFLAMYGAMLKEKGRLFAALAGLAYMAIALGSASEVVALMIMILYVILQSAILYLKEDNETLKEFLLNNGIIFIIGPALSSGLIKGLFYYGSVSFFYPMMFLSALLFGALLYALREKVSDKQALKFALPIIVLVGLLGYFLTPAGDLVRGFAGSTVSIAQYNAPLDRTIAEQHPASSDLSGSLGFIAASYPSGIDLVMGILSAIVNLGLALIMGLLNFFLGTSISFQEKTNSLLLFWVAALIIALAYSLYRSKDEKMNVALLFAAAIFPPFLIGIIKAKYTIYAGFLLAAGIGVVFGEAQILAKKYIAHLGENFYHGMVVVAALLILLQMVQSSGGLIPPVLSQSLKTRFQDDPSAFKAKFQSICTSIIASGETEDSICSQYSSAGIPICSNYDASICSIAADPLAYAEQGTNEQYSTKLCYYSLIDDILEPSTGELIAANFRCKRISDYWIETMEWIKANTSEDARFTSWWDYGHWTNFFGQRDTVLRNEHASHFMIGEVAYDYLDGTPQELADFMRSRNSSFAIFDAELIGSPTSLGGKYGALNYLMCARNNETDVSSQTGISSCEAEHLWETILIPVGSTAKECTISKTGNRSGTIAYTASWSLGATSGYHYTPFYPATPIAYCYGSSLNDANTYAVCQNLVKVSPAYCVGDVLMANGQKSTGTYYLNQTYPNGDLKLNKAIVVGAGQYSQTLHIGDVISANLFYTNSPIFLENGNITDGYDDRSMKFYSSNLYRAIFLGEIPGFTKVFESEDSMVKIFKLNN